MRIRTLVAGLALLATTAAANATFVEFESMIGPARANGTPALANSNQLHPYNPAFNDGFQGHDTYDAGIGSLAAGANDVDMYAFYMGPNNLFSAMSSPLNPQFFTPDTIMGLYRFNGAVWNLVVANDDAGNDNPGSGYGSALRYYSPNDGIITNYLLVVSGYRLGGTAAFPATLGANDTVPGAHSQSGNYALTLSIFGCFIPEPASLSLLAIGALALIRRRR